MEPEHLKALADLIREQNIRGSREWAIQQIKMGRPRHKRHQRISDALIAEVMWYGTQEVSS